MNLMPSNYEEAKMLIPGLQPLPQEAVAKIVNFLHEKRGISAMRH